MAKLELFDGKCTKYQGLWYHPEQHAYTSTVFSMAGLRQFKGPVSLRIIKNRYYNGGENGRPNYLFSIRDANYADARELEVEDIDEEDDDAYWYTVERHVSLLNAYYAFCCSKCGFDLNNVTPEKIHKYQYCPHCGVHMVREAIVADDYYI